MAVKRSRARPAKRARAGTADVVGNGLRKIRVPSKWKKHYQRLLAARNQLMNRQGDLVRDASEEQPAFSLHMADAGTDSFDRDFALSQASSEQDAVYEIDEALDRIQSGRYGICELTGKPIEANRLEAVPWTRFSAAAEKQLEKEGSLRRAKLAPRAPLSGSGEAGEERVAEEEE